MLGVATSRNSTASPRPETKELNTIARGAGISLVGFLSIAVLDLAFYWLLARAFGPATVGIIGLSLSVMQIAITLALFGLQIGIVRFVGSYAGQGDQARTAGAIIAGLRIVGGLSLIVAASLFGLADLLAVRVYDTPALGPVLRLLALSIPFSATMIYLLSVAQGLKRVEYRAVIAKMVVPLLRIGGLIVVVYVVGPSTVGVAWAVVVAFIVGAILAAISVWRLYPLRGQRGRPVLVTRTMLAFSWPLLLTAVFDRTWLETQTLVIGAFSTSAQVGIFYMALRAAALLTAFLIIFSSIFAPIMAELHDRQQLSRLGSLLKTVTRWGFSLCFPVFLFLFAFSAEIMLVFGPEFTAGAGVLRILALSQLIVVAAGPVRRLLTMAGHPRFNLLNAVLALGLNVTLAFLLIPRYGIMGAATGFALSMLLISTLRLIEVYAVLRIHPYDRSYLKPIAAGILSVFAAIGLSFLVPDWPTPVRVALSAFVLILVYVAALVFLRLDEDDSIIVDAFRRQLNHLVTRPVAGS